MNSENSKTSKYHVLVLKLADKLDLRRGQKSVALSNLSIYYKWKNINSSYKNNKFKISAPTWSDEFELKDGPYSISDIQDFFKYILKMYSENVDNPSTKILVKKIKKRSKKDLVGNTNANKITCISKKKPASEPHLDAASSEIPKERYIFPQERQLIIDELRLT